MITSDGELDEGSTWEAVLFAGAKGLSNLVMLVDYNKIQATDRVEKRFNSNPMASKWEAFGWNVMEIDGHDAGQVCEALDKAEQIKGVPTAIVAHTIKGKGIPFAEDTAAFHNGSMTEEQYNLAVHVLEAKKRSLECGL